MAICIVDNCVCYNIKLSAIIGQDIELSAIIGEVDGASEACEDDSAISAIVMVLLYEGELSML